jgi:hypothetical protein
MKSSNVPRVGALVAVKFNRRVDLPVLAAEILESARVISIRGDACGEQ